MIKMKRLCKPITAFLIGSFSHGYDKPYSYVEMDFYTFLTTMQYVVNSIVMKHSCLSQKSDQIA